MSKRLEERSLSSRGAASGIGVTYAEQGAKVVLGDIQDDAGAALAEALGGTSMPGFATCHKRAEVQALVDTAVSTVKST